MNTQPDLLAARLERLETNNAELRVHIAGVETRNNGERRRLRVQTGLALLGFIAAVFISPTNRASIAQGYGVTLASLDARLKAVEAKIASLDSRQQTAEAQIVSLQEQINHIPAGPQGPKGDKGDTGAQGPQGPAGPQGKSASIAYNRYPFVVQGGRDAASAFVIPDNPNYNLYSVNPGLYTGFAAGHIVLPHANSVPAGTVLMIRQEPSDAYDNLVVDVQSGDSLDHGDNDVFRSIPLNEVPRGYSLSYTTLGLRVYSDGAHHWSSDSRIVVPALYYNSSGEGG